MTEQSEKERYGTAIHEAGHAVANWLQDVSFSKISIVASDECEGFVQPEYSDSDLDVLEDFPEDPLPRRAFVERGVICLLAGGAAEGRFLGRSARLAAGDEEKASSILEGITESDRELG